MSRRLDDLSSDLRPLAYELLAKLTERKVYVVIVDTLRTLREHQANLAAGTSKTTLSKHLPRRMRGVVGRPDDAEKSDALDLAVLVATDKGWQIDWNDANPGWAVIGEVAESLGLRWGGRWKSPHDPGHVEWVPLTPRESGGA